MNPKKIACITCVTDDGEYNEQLFYLKRQILPEGFELEYIPVRGAASMAAGYNAAMSSSDALYKIYTHQDSFLVDPQAISTAISLFEEHPDIGIIGAVGVSNLNKHGLHTMDYDRGRIDHNGYPHRLVFEEPDGSDSFSYVETVDGSLIMTSKDLPWREDLFDAWDFYDASQCQEFLKAGYKVVVPYFDSTWFYHDNSYSNMLGYYDYKKIFINEYFPERDYRLSDSGKRAIEYAGIQKQTIEMLTGLAQENQRQSLYEVFKNNDFRGHGHLRELEALTSIDYLENGYDTEIRMWGEKEPFSTAIDRLRSLKYLIKRLEYKAYDDRQGLIEEIRKGYSRYSIIEVAGKYSIDPEEVIRFLE